ncbi:uncharacterized protein [Palaemon carinicauda]|uniref:uncharacterized protein n=1 Tax=Palaemon carinicauda TaxID=392227 RepID=UPI0035B5CE01
MANAKQTMKLNKCCNYDLTGSGRVYPEFCLHLMDDCVAPVVFGHDFLQLHKQVSVDFGGMLPPLELRITEMIEKIITYCYFNSIDLKAAYNQIPMNMADQKYTAFEAEGRLFEFMCLPFGVINGATCFQQVLNEIIDKEQLKVNDHQVLPDPERMRPLLEINPPDSTPSLKRTLGLLSHYEKWVPNFSQKIRPLVKVKTFPMAKSAEQALEELKNEISRASLAAIDDEAIVVVVTDASADTVAASLTRRKTGGLLFSLALRIGETTIGSGTRSMCYRRSHQEMATLSARTYAKIKPKFSKETGTLIKAIRSLKRLAIDFKGRCRPPQRTVWGLPQYIHSGSGPAFGSSEYQKFLHYREVAIDYLSVFNPRGNGQIERANGTLWRTIRLALASLSLPIKMWEAVLDQALHSMKSLLCVATN